MSDIMLDLRPPPKDARARWVKALQGELEHCVSLGIDMRAHGATLRTMVGHKATWHWSNDIRYDYRTILPNETVFDVGDQCKTWEEVVDQSEALWDDLDAMVHGGVYYAALSGGRGTHTHLFLEDPTDGAMWDGTDFAAHDLRPKIADWVTFRRMAVGGTRVHPDPVCIAPSHGGRQLREFGSIKSRAKTLFFTGPSGRRPLPRDQAEAYLVAGLKYPSDIRRCRSVDGLQHARLRAALGVRCPREAACVVSQETCQDCPL